MCKCFELFLSKKSFRYILTFIILDAIFILLVILSGFNISKIKSNNLETLKNVIFQNKSFPLFHFFVGLNSPSSDHLVYESFYTWKGTIKGSKQDINPVKINKIFQNNFFYEKSNMTYFDYLKTTVKDSENCEDDYKKCGILDSNRNILCLPKGEECPLNDFKISEIEQNDLLPEYNQIHVVDSITGIKKYIYFSNNKVDNNIITNFELSSDEPCIAIDEYNWISANLNEKEKSSICKTYINDKLFDTNYFEVGNNIPMKSLYYDNKIQIFNDYSDEKVKLYARNYYYINEECANKFIIEYSIIEKTNNDKTIQIRTIEYINIPLILIHLVLFFFALKDRKINTILIILSNIFIIFLVVINSIIFFRLKMDKISDFKCGCEIMNLKINNFINRELLLIKRPKLFIFISLIIALAEFIIQNYAFYTFKKNNFKRLYVKSDIF